MLELRTKFGNFGNFGHISVGLWKQYSVRTQCCNLIGSEPLYIPCIGEGGSKVAERKDNWVSYQSYKSFVIINRMNPSKKVIIKNYHKLLNFVRKKVDQRHYTRHGGWKWYNEDKTDLRVWDWQNHTPNHPLYCATVRTNTWLSNFPCAYWKPFICEGLYFRLDLSVYLCICWICFVYQWVDFNHELFNFQIERIPKVVLLL